MLFSSCKKKKFGSKFISNRIAEIVQVFVFFVFYDIFFVSVRSKITKKNIFGLSFRFTCNRDNVTTEKTES